MQTRVKTFVESSRFKNFIIFLIVINGITMGLETSKEIYSSYQKLFEIFNIFVITIFTIEILLKLYIYKTSFFKDAWNNFDFFVVAISLIPSNAGFEILRVLRVLRLFRLITVVPQMRKIVSALLSTIPSMASIIVLMSLFFYISAIMATKLFGETHPQWFGNLGESFYTLFQIMTLESWSMGIVRPIMESHPHAWLFFIPFIFIVTFIMINLIVAIVVDAMNEIALENKKEELSKEEEILQEIKRLREELKSYKQK